MKRRKKLLIMSCALLLLCCFTYWLSSLNLNDTVDDTEVSTSTFFSVDTAALTSLSWSYGGETLAFSYDDSIWSYTEDNAFPLDNDLLTTVITAATNIEATKTIENVEDYSQYGLDNAVCTISVTSDEAYEILIGDETSIGSERYLSIGDGNVYLVDSSLLDNFTYTLYDFVKEEELPAMNDLDSLSITAANHSLEIYHDKNSTLTAEDGTAYFWFGKDDASTEDIALDTSMVENFTANITGMSFLECIDYNADEEALSLYGLDEPMATITINYIETTEIDTGETDEEGINIFEYEETVHTLTLELGNFYDEYNYIRIQDSNIVYLVNSTLYNTIAQTTYETLMPTETETEYTEETTSE